MLQIVWIFSHKTSRYYFTIDINRGKLLRHPRSSSRSKCGRDKNARFERLSKKYHPDIHSRNKLWAESKTKIIIQAYKTLSDSVTREQYDKQYKHLFQTRKKSSFSKKETTLDSDIQARIRVIFFDLLEGHSNSAIDNYERLLQDFDAIDFFSYLNHRDYIDCKFFIG